MGDSPQIGHHDETKGYFFNLRNRKANKLFIQHIIWAWFYYILAHKFEVLIYWFYYF